MHVHQFQSLNDSLYDVGISVNMNARLLKPVALEFSQDTQKRGRSIVLRLAICSNENYQCRFPYLTSNPVLRERRGVLARRPIHTTGILAPAVLKDYG